MAVLSALRGEIASRYLVHFRVQPERLRALLPPALAPLEVRGAALVGVSWTRLTHPARRWLPLPGISDLLSWRCCVQVPGRSGPRSGVWIARRDSSGGLAAQVAGRLAPGLLQLAHFEVDESVSKLELRVHSQAQLEFELCAQQVGPLRGSHFASLRELQEFVNSLALVRPMDGYFAELDGPRPGGRDWCAQVLELQSCRAPWLEQRFGGEVEVDSALRLSTTRDLLLPVSALDHARQALRGGVPCLPAL